MTKAASYSVNGQLRKAKLLDQGSAIISMSQDPLESLANQGPWGPNPRIWISSKVSEAAVAAGLGKGNLEIHGTKLFPLLEVHEGKVIERKNTLLGSVSNSQ